MTPRRAPGQTSGPVYRPYGKAGEPIIAELPVDGMFTDTALSYIEKNKEKKFFLMLCYISPHEPYIMPEKYRRMYNPRDIHLPPNYRPKPAGSEAVPLGEEEAKKLRANHFGMTSYLDEQVGRIMETVDRLGISHRTMIVFTSDNGYMLGSQGYVAKQVLYEEAIKVPLIFNLPSRFKPRVVDELVYVMDILPTLMELNSVPVPEYVSARSLLPLLEGRDVTVHDRIFSETGPAGSIAVRTKEWKWIFDPHVGDQLYDIAKDPYETRNLITDPQYGDILNELKNHVR